MPFVLILEPAEQRIPAGAAPVLRLTVENAGCADERVIWPHRDLQDTFYDLVITQGGTRAELPRMISDPCWRPEYDLLTLRPGEAVTFEFTEFAWGFEYLPPGEYQVQIRFWQGFHLKPALAVLSPAVTVRIEE
jgi:hypothetical protein